MTVVSISDTNPNGLTPPAGVARATAWRPEQDIADSLHALAARIDHRDPDFDAIASIGATRLLMAGAELDVIAKRRERARQAVIVTVEVASRRRAPRWMGGGW